MSQENVEIVRRLYEGMVVDPEAVRDLWAPEVVLDVEDVAFDVGVVRGVDRLYEALLPYFSTFEEFRIEIDEVIHADAGQVVTAIHDDGRMAGSEAQVRNNRFHAWTLADGKVIRLSAHLTRERVLEVAGLSE